MLPYLFHKVISCVPRIYKQKEKYVLLENHTLFIKIITVDISRSSDQSIKFHHSVDKLF